jgi:hypothetical protein
VLAPLDADTTALPRALSTGLSIKRNVLTATHNGCDHQMTENLLAYGLGRVPERMFVMRKAA